MNFEPDWELTTFFTEDSCQEAMERLQCDLIALKKEPSTLKAFIADLQKCDALFKEIESYIHCLMSENTQNKRATQFYANLMDLNQHLNDLMIQLEQELKEADLSDLDPEIHFFLNEKKENAQLKLPFEKESLINALEPDGFHGYASMYDHLKNQIEIKAYETNESLSYPEAENRLTDPNRLVRQYTHRALMDAFKKEEDLYGETLNRISGFRLKTYQLRGWDHFLDEPLRLNRLNESTLNAMYGAIENKRDTLIQFCEDKAQKLKLKKLSWYDIEAPDSLNEKTYSFDEASQLILDAFGKYSAKLQDFAHRALTSKWIDATERKNKRAGGFCTSFALAKQTRIFMNYKGTFDNVLTLAHELGHAFHADVTFDLPLFNQAYPMNLAETASTMCEQMVLDSIPNDKKGGRNAAYLMNLPARFYFEKELYSARKKGFVPAEQLTEMMINAQKKAFFNQLDEYCPHFWASKMHFYFTDVPFYNFPYTFGFLFSLGTYLKLQEDPTSFEKRYIDLLKDTGRMTTEDLAQKHLGVDLSQPHFFESTFVEKI